MHASYSQHLTVLLKGQQYPATDVQHTLAEHGPAPWFLNSYRFLTNCCIIPGYNMIRNGIVLPYPFQRANLCLLTG